MEQQLNKNLRTDSIEIEVLNIGVNEFSLGILPNIRSAKRIISIEAYSVSQVSNAISSKAVINAAVFAKSFIKLVDTNNVEYRTIPLYTN